MPDMHQTDSTRLKQLILGHLYQMKGGLALAGVCLVGFSLAQLLTPWPLKVIFDNILLEKPLTSPFLFLDGLLAQGPGVSLVVISCSIVVIALLGATFSYLQLFITARIGHQLTHVLRRELFSRLQRLSLSFHNQSRSGELLTKVATDTTALKDLFADWALTMAAHLLMLVGMLGIMLWMNWQLSLVPLATLPVLFIILFHINRRIKDNVRTQRKHEGKMASTISEVLTSMPLVQAFGREDYEEDRFAKRSEQNLEAGIRTARASASVTKSVAVVSSIGVAATVLLGSLQVLKGRLTPGELLIFVTYMNSLYKPVRHLGKLSAKFARALVSAQRIAGILAIEPEIHDSPDAIPAANLKGSIVFNDVSFEYEPGNKVLDHVSFRIEHGQRVALVGESGAGKSTIVSLLLRLYEAKGGAITIDGVDIDRYQRESLRNQVGIVLQDNILFGASVAENIAYGKLGATAEEIEQAARLARAHDFIESLPAGYDTILGERASTISGGQRQRICLARAFIKRPPILVLDEPMSAIDPVSASLISDAIDTVQAGKTTLVISHQLSSMVEFDQIFVLKNGSIVEQGAHDRLLDTKGYYFELYRRQSA